MGKGVAAGIKQGSGGGIDWAECEPAAGGSGKDVKGIGGVAIEGEKDGLDIGRKGQMGEDTGGRDVQERGGGETELKGKLFSSKTTCLEM